MNYFYSQEYEGNFYTVDMLRFHTHIEKKSKFDLTSYLDETNFSKRWNDSGFGKFGLNYIYNTLWIGVNCKNEGNIPLICFEFNPNKMTNDEWVLFYRLLDLFYFDLTLKRFDFAVDVPMNINDLKFTSLTKKAYSVYYTDFNDKTFYMGKGNGHIKIYNKKLESNLTYELTRFEVTRECDLLLKLHAYNDIDFKFPVFTSEEFTYDKSIGTDCSLDAMQFALNNGFPINGLSRSYKSYFKKQLHKDTQFNNQIANKVFHHTLDLIMLKKPII